MKEKIPPKFSTRSSRVVKLFKLKLMLLILMAFVNSAEANSYYQQDKIITGTVVDEAGIPLPGVTVTIFGLSRGAITDFDGNFELKNVKANNKLVFSYIGFETMTVDIGNETVFNIILKSKLDELDEVTIVAFGKQKKESVVASVTTVKPSELRIPSSNLTTSLAGRVSGLISYQRTGEPGIDNAQFFIRGVTTFGFKRDPLILVDGNQVDATSLSRLHPDDVATFSIMKDASATALYGARGANGVVLVTTKEGKEGKAKISLRMEHSISRPTQTVDIADPVTFMKLHNEAVATRNRLVPTPYSQNKIDNTIAGVNSLAFPGVNWQDILFKNQAVNQRVNLNISGGGKVARYYVAGSLSDDQGVLKVDSRNNFNNNINFKRYQLRTNVNINLSKTTKINVRLSGAFDDYTGPIDGGADIYRQSINASPVAFSPVYPAEGEYENIKHTIFGGSQESLNNPYANLVSGYKDSTKSHMYAQFELHQELDFITEGLKFRGMFNTNRYSFFDVSRQYTPYYYELAGYNSQEGSYRLNLLNENTATETLGYQEGEKEITSDVFMEGALEYSREIEKSTISGLLVATRRHTIAANAGDLQASLPARNLNIAGRFAYNYDSRYFAEFNFGYNGSERFSKSERFGFFPSIGLGWLISNESFYGDKLKNTVNKLKLRLTHGLAGNDAIASASERFLYLSNVNLNDGSRGATFGNGILGVSRPGISISRYANDQVTWEIAEQSNLALEVGLWKSLDITAEVFREHRTNIFLERSFIPYTLGLQATPSANVGEVKSKGFEVSVNYNKSFNKDVWLQATGNFTYADNKIEKYEEPDYSATPWKSQVGYAVSQPRGLIAERLFIDDEDIRNSPEQFGDYMPGDIKYKDINGDGAINSLDEVPIGNPTTPRIVYGFGFSVGWKSFDLSTFFQGSASSSFFLDIAGIAPFRDKTSAVLQVIADDHWSEDNRNEYAFWPRLSEGGLNDNNLRSSNWWLRDNSFLRLKTIELGYNLDKKWADKMNVSNLRLYLSGNNLLTFSKFKLWDPEMSGGGLNYPIQKVFNVGLKLDF